MKMFNCAAVFLAVLYLVVVLVNARSIRDNCNVWDIASKEHPETACAVTVEPDKDEDRIPPVLYKIKCAGCNGKCPINYTCTQLKTDIKVHYNSTDKIQDYTIYTGCMCAKQGDLKEATTGISATYR